MTTIYVHNGDIGTVFRLTITDTAGTAIDVSTARQVYLLPGPDWREGAEDRRVYHGNGSDGKISTTIAGDIDMVGTWQVQGYVETSLGKFWTEGQLQVYSTLATA